MEEACFDTQSSKKKIKKTDKEDPEKKRDEEVGKNPKQEKTDDLSNKESSDLKETTPLGPKDLRTDKVVPPRFNPKPISDLGSRSQDLKDF